MTTNNNFPSVTNDDQDLVDSNGSGRPNKDEGPSGDPGIVKPDPFNLDSLRLSQDFEAMVGGEKVLTTVHVRKPGKEQWIRVHPDDKFRIDVLTLELKEESEIYLVSADLMYLLGTESTLRPMTLYATITRNGDVFLWPIACPGVDGKDNEWHRSAREAAHIGMKRWIRVTANRSLGAYETSITKATLPDPTWPTQTLQDLVRIAFRKRFIDTVDHPVLRRLRGEI
ncbi:hypothetical protein K2Y11_08390 [bacterium]|nr:hypothetical protein [bacterium]